MEILTNDDAYNQARKLTGIKEGTPKGELYYVLKALKKLDTAEANEIIKRINVDSAEIRKLIKEKKY